MLNEEPKNAELSRPAKPPVDELVNRLRDSIRQQRPRRLGTFLIVVILLGLVLGCLFWFFWPRTDHPELLVIGFDHVAPAGKSISVRVATEPRKQEVQRWGGRGLFLQEIAALGVNRAKPVQVKTNDFGIAQIAWPLNNAASLIEIEAVYIDDKSTPPWFDRSRIRVFSWPSASRVLILDVEKTLKKTDDWPALSKALAESAAAGWQLVYLAVDADTPLSYSALRNWVLEQVASSEDPLPDGPVLSRLKLLENESNDMARKTVLATLKSEFTGPVIYLIANEELQLRAVEANGDVFGDAIVLPTWSDLLSKLPK